MSFPVITPKPDYDSQNDAVFREEVRKRLVLAYDKRGDLIVPIGKRLAFTSPQGQVITFGYNNDGQFTIQQDANSPFGLASISYVSSVETSLEGQIAVLEVDVEAANDAAAAAASSAISAQTSATNAGNSATAAQTSATNASTSATNAGTSATNASNSASNASTSASQASTSASNAAGSASNASTSATNAANSATSAGNSASAASTSASNAATSATNAGNSATSAQNSATSASTQASNAATSASQASTSASNAATSASQASTSASNAAGSASTASTQATNAANSATSAGNSATAASTSASNASTSATNASTSASAAQTSATNAAASATNAAGSASTATTQASNASASAASAASSATLSANYAKQGGVAYTVSDFVASGLFWTADFGGSPTTVADPPAAYSYEDVSGVGRVARVSLASGNSYLQPKAVFTPVVGRKYRVRVTAKVTTDATGGGTLEVGFYINGLTSAFVHTDPSSDWTWSADGSRPSFDSAFTVADGVVNFGIIYTCTAVSANSAYWRPRFSMARSGGAGGVIEIREFLIEEITDIATTNATISLLQQAVSDGDSANAQSISTLSSRVSAEYKSRANLLKNSSFYRGGNDWILTGSPQFFTSYESGYIWFGAQSYQSAYQDVRTDPGTRYCISGEIYRSATNASSRLYVQWLSEDRNTSLGYGAVLNHPSTGWAYVKSDLADGGTVMVAPTGANWARIFVDNYQPGAYPATQSGMRYLSFHSGDYVRPWEEGKLEADFRTAQANITNLQTTTTDLQNNKASATALTTLSASVTPRIGAATGSLLVNPAFSDYPVASGSIPPGWSNWANGTSSSRGTGRVGTYAHIQDGLAGQSGGLVQVRRCDPGKYNVDIAIERSAGSVTGAGVWVEFYNSSNTYLTGVAFPFSTTPDVNGATGVSPGYDYRQFRRVVTAPANTYYVYVYLMNHWTGFGESIAAYNQIYWHQLDMYPAGYGESQVDVLRTAVADGTGAFAYYGVKVGAGNRFASFEALADTKTNISAFKINADTFQVFNGTTDEVPFEVVSGAVKIKSANVGTLNIGSGGLTIQSGSSGARIVISNSRIEVYDATRLRVRLGIW